MRKVICFHKPEEENGYLSNWYPAIFKCNTHTFSSVEQYMMYEKARIFQDESVMERILSTDNPSTIKRLGRMVKNYDESIWNKKRREIVFYGNLEKFSQNADLKVKLQNTKDALLVECSVRDKIWGIGLSMKDKHRFEPEFCKGTNLQGNVLMEVRDMITMDSTGVSKR